MKTDGVLPEWPPLSSHEVVAASQRQSCDRRDVVVHAPEHLQSKQPGLFLALTRSGKKKKKSPDAAEEVSREEEIHQDFLPSPSLHLFALKLMKLFKMEADPT